MGARHFFVTGRVQGVGFRWFVRHEAQSLGVSGWVRNCSDGSVEVWAEGSDSLLDDLEAVLYRGPSGSRVSYVKAESSNATGLHGGFEIKF